MDELLWGKMIGSFVSFDKWERFRELVGLEEGDGTTYCMHFWITKERRCLTENFRSFDSLIETIHRPTLQNPIKAIKSSHKKFQSTTKPLHYHNYRIFADLFKLICYLFLFLCQTLMVVVVN